MNISCPNCKVKYDIPSAYFANGQQRVRCSNCAFEWEHRDPNSEHLQAQEAYREEVDDDPDPDIGEGFAFLDGALVAQRSQPVWVQTLEAPHVRRLVITALVASLLACLVYFTSNSVVRALPPLAGLYRLVGVEPVAAFKGWDLCLRPTQPTQPILEGSDTSPSVGFEFDVQNRAQVGRIVPHIGRQKAGTQPPTHILDNGYVGGRNQRVLHVQDQQLQSVDGGQWYLEDGNAKRRIQACKT